MGYDPLLDRSAWTRTQRTGANGPLRTVPDDLKSLCGCRRRPKEKDKKIELEVFAGMDASAS
jgi:hypothetical protein